MMCKEKELIVIKIMIMIKVKKETKIHKKEWVRRIFRDLEQNSECNIHVVFFYKALVLNVS